MQLLKLFFCSIMFFVFVTNTYAQTGSFTATFTSADGSVKPVTISLTKPLFKFDNPHGYWFINPHNNYKHFNTQPDQGYADRKEELNGIAFISFNQSDDDFDVYDLNDSISMQLQKGKYIIGLPKYDPKIGDKNKPLHIHISSITSKEISFTLSGAAALTFTEGYAEASIGTITGSGHFYREPTYVKSDMLPGCNCDPTIYAAVYDEENNVRTTSACEAALRNKLFDAVQKSLSPLFTNVQVQHSGNMNAGEINIAMLPGCVDINEPEKARPYCSSDYFHNALTATDAHKKIFTNEDAYGLRFIKAPGDEELHPSLSANTTVEFLDSMTKLMQANKINITQYSKALQDYADKHKGGNNNDPDYKKMEVEHNLYVKIVVNASDKTQTSLKPGNKAKTVVQHNVKGGAFEIFSPMIKDSDGDWIPNRLAIFLGKFTPPVMGQSNGRDVETTDAVYPANANKLSIYNIIIKMEGAKDLMDKAIAAIDFSSLQGLITKQ